MTMNEVDRAAAALAAIGAARWRAQQQSRVWLDQLEAALVEIARFAEELRSLAPSGLRLHAKTEDGDMGRHPRILITLGTSEALDHDFSGEATLTSPARLILELQLSCAVHAVYHPPFVGHQREEKRHELACFLPSGLDAPCCDPF
jgi:hypothetical protein